MPSVQCYGCCYIITGTTTEIKDHLDECMQDRVRLDCESLAFGRSTNGESSTAAMLPEAHPTGALAPLTDLNNQSSQNAGSNLENMGPNYDYDYYGDHWTDDDAPPIAPDASSITTDASPITTDAPPSSLDAPTIILHAPLSTAPEPMEVDDLELRLSQTTPSLSNIFNTQLQAGLLESLDANSPTTAADGSEIIDLREFHLTNESHIQCSMDLYAMAADAGLPRETFDAMMRRVNAYIEGLRPKLLSFYRAKNELRRSYPVKPKPYDVCPDGCKMYKDDDTRVECEHCNKPRYKDGSTTPVKQMQQLPLKQQLAVLIKDEETRKLLKYRSTRQRTEGVLKDVFDGGVYKEMEMNNELFKDDMDIALGLYTDDFTRFRRGGQSMMIVHLVVLNLPPDVRYEDKNMLQVCVTPGPNKPHNLFSFLAPLLEDLSSLCHRGITVKTEKGDFTAKAHLFFAGGDIPAVSKLAGHSGHSHYRGCRFCTIEGVYINHTMTFPPMKRRGEGETRLKLKIRSSASYTEVTDVNATGQKQITPFASLPTFHGATFFPIDVMHLLGPGIGKHLWRVICGDFGVENNPLYLDGSQRQLLGARISASRTLIPSSFAGDCGDLTYQSSFFRAVDWIHFVRYFVPTVLLEFYDNSDTRNALLDLAMIYHYAFSRELQVDQLAELKATSTSFTSWLQGHVDQGNITPTVFTPNVHYLSHLYKYIERVGPLPFVAAFAMERAIGTVKRRMNSTRYPGTNAGNVLIDLAAIRRRKRQTQSNDENHNQQEDQDDEQVDISTQRKSSVIFVSDEKNSPEIWGPFAQDTVRDLNCRSYLRDFWAWQNRSYTGVNINMEELLETGSRLLKDGVTYGGSNKESFVVLQVWVDKSRQNRTNQNVVPIHRQYFGSIKFFFKHQFSDSEKLLAFVEVYRTIEIDGPYPYMTESGGSKYLVVDIDNIVGFAGRAQGWNTRQYVYWKRQNSPPHQDLPIDHGLEYI